MESEKDTREKLPNPRASANPFSVLTFGWTFRMFFKGYRHDLQVSDLYTPLDEHLSSNLGDRVERCWKEEVKKAQKANREPSLLRVLVKLFGAETALFGVVLALLENVVNVCQPLFLGRLLDYFTPGTLVSKNSAYLHAGALIICSFINILITHPYMLAVLHTGMKIRVGCCSLIYRKALGLTKSVLGQTTVGQVVNLLSNDVNRFDSCIIFLHYLWIGPLNAIVVTFFLWTQVGLSCVIGVVVLVLFIPLQVWLGRSVYKLRQRSAVRTDKRIRLMNEIISGIQVIKMFTWEKAFNKLISLARRNELKAIQGTCHVKGVLLSFIIYNIRLAIFCSLLSYVLFGNYITAKKVFVVTSYYNVLLKTMTVFFPSGIGQVAEALISVRRIQRFLLQTEVSTPAINCGGDKVNKTTGMNGKMNGELNGKCHRNNSFINRERMSRTESEMSLQSISDNKELYKHAVFIKNGCAKWNSELSEDTLHDINLFARPGKLTAIIGSVGSSKTSLLEAILGELQLYSGEVKVYGNVSYSSQEPWLFAGSIRQNILFGSKYNSNRYKAVIKACALLSDFSQLPYGDQTIVGDRGISLSGGQRARINLARAIYREADIYLLDDPLSAVDSDVGKHLFEECILGFLKNKTCILVTHQLQYLNCVDHIVLIENGKIEAEGSYKDIQESRQDFTEMILSTREDTHEERANILRKTSCDTLYQPETAVTVNGHEQQLVAETKSSGMVGSIVYKTYVSAAGHWCRIGFLLLLCALTQILATGSDYWIAYWVNSEEYPYNGTYSNGTTLISLIAPSVMNQTFNPCHAFPLYSPNMPTNVFPNPITISPNHSMYIPDMPLSPLSQLSVTANSTIDQLVTRKICICIFATITVLTVIVTLLRAFVLVNMCMKASMVLHNGMFHSITRATMRFFNTNSSGRILNRFTKDMGIIDEKIPSVLIDCLQDSLSMVGIVVVIIAINPLMLIPTCVITVIFYYLRKFYLCTSRSIKRLEGVTKSPVFSHLNASLQGLTTIRAFSAQNILAKEFDSHQDLHSSAWYFFIASSRAFGLWLDLVCIAYITLVTFSFLFLDLRTYGGNVGLAITQSISMTRMFQWGMRQSAELENQMTSVERVLEYFSVEKEPPLESEPEKKPPASWPEHGRIEMSNVYLSYSSSEAPVLRNLNLVIESKQKIGVVGRTGAGKSSLITALFRLTEVDGEIRIDDILTKSIGLHDLRSKISIIPQEPVLFSGTIRKNLDPFDEFSDNILWSALEEVELKGLIVELDGGLHAKVSERGANFSVGQRQLVCLARAIVHNNRILILDEATANVDPQTDALIQRTIRRKFQKCTILTIAHRLHSVMDSDKILVMDSGTLVEFDHPHILLQHPSGFLFKMVEQTGKQSAKLLHNIAAINYELSKGQKLEPGTS